MAFADDIPRTHSFSVGDLHDYDRCVFRFFVQHHLGKKYELAEGSENMAVGSLLDLSLKKLHQIEGYNEDPEYLVSLVKAAERQMREDVESRGKNSFYGSQITYLTPEVVAKAQEVFKNYCLAKKGKFKKLVKTKTMQKIKPFWKYIMGEPKMQLWGGPDAIEMGGDGVPEVVDYKYFEDLEKGKANLDMDLMPKVYALLTADDLYQSGFKKFRFVIRMWTDPENDSYFEEFEIDKMPYLETFLKDKIERILRTTDLTFCDKPYCKVCNSDKREEWIAELLVKGHVGKSPQPTAILEEPSLPF